MATARRRIPLESVNHSARAPAAEVGLRRLADLGIELVRRRIPESLVYPGHIRARDGCPVSHEGHGCSLESSAEEAVPV
jgi:hypothetical protein